MNLATARVTARIETLVARLRASQPARAARLARAAAGASVTCPVHEIDGAAPPRLAGESYYWTTPSGKTRVEHPNAYGWPTRYWPSTLRVEVGREWLAAQ